MNKFLTSSALVAILATTPALAGPSDEPGFAAGGGHLTVSAGYAYTVGAGGHPEIWSGSPNVVFIGTSDPFDAGAIKLHNQNPFAVIVKQVSVDFGPMTGVNVWAAALPVTLPPGGQLILTQTAFYNFDTSDMPMGGVSCIPNGIIPIVHVKEKVGIAKAKTYHFLDDSQKLNTGGIDAGICGKAEDTTHWQVLSPAIP